MPTAAELIEQLNALEGDEATAAIKFLLNDQGTVIKQARGKIATAAKSEGSGKSKVPELERQLQEATDRVAELEGENEELKSKAPNLAQREQELKTKHENKVRELQGKIDDLNVKLKTKGREVHLEKFEKALVENHHVFPKYANRVARRDFEDRFDEDESGAPRILKPGETTPYEAESVDRAIELLAADAAKTIDPEFIRSAAGEGGGRRGTPGGSVATTPEQTVQAKKKSGRYAGQL